MSLYKWASKNYVLMPLKGFFCLVKTSRVLDLIFHILLNLVIPRTGERVEKDGGEGGINVTFF